MCENQENNNDAIKQSLVPEKKEEVSIKKISKPSTSSQEYKDLSSLLMHKELTLTEINPTFICLVILLVIEMVSYFATFYIVYQELDNCEKSIKQTKEGLLFLGGVIILLQTIFLSFSFKENKKDRAEFILLMNIIKGIYEFNSLLAEHIKTLDYDLSLL